MDETVLVSFELPCDIRSKWRELWRDDSFYLRYMELQGDRDITLSSWAQAPGSGSGGDSVTMVREVECSHPVKTSFPGMPSHTRCLKQQTSRVAADGAGGGFTLTLTEAARFEGIPYSDYFTVSTFWCVVEVVSAAPRCKVTVSCRVEFIKSTWLRGQISSNTELELKDAIALWHHLAIEHLAQLARAPRSLAASGAPPTLASAPPAALGPAPGLRRSQASDPALRRDAFMSPVSEAGSGWDSDAEFFDAEGEATGEAEGDDDSLDAGPTSPVMLTRSASGGVRSLGDRAGSLARDGSGGGGDGELESAGRILREVWWVVTGFGWASVKSLRVATFAPLFSPSPSQLALRLAAALAPVSVARTDLDPCLGTGGAAAGAGGGGGGGGGFGATCGNFAAAAPPPPPSRGQRSSRLAALLLRPGSRPDLFGPVLLCLTLVQVLVWCIDVTGELHRVHCRREALLASSVAASAASWLLAAGLHLTLAFLLGARVTPIAGLSVAGYENTGVCNRVASTACVLSHHLD